MNRTSPLSRCRRAGVPRTRGDEPSVDGERHEALTMRRPKVRDVKSAERSGGGSNAETEIRLFANLCEVAPAVIEELDLEDYERLQAEFGAMVPKADSPRPPT